MDKAPAMKNFPSSPDSPWAGDSDRPIQDNGLFGKNSYQMGEPSGNSFPAAGKPSDYRLTPGEAPEGAGDNEGAGMLEMDDFGLNEKVEVGNNASIANYGITGQEATGQGETGDKGD